MRLEKVLDAAATPREHGAIDLSGQSIDGVETADNFFGRTDALHANRDDPHVDPAPATPQHFQKVPNRRAGRAGNDRDATRKRRQRSFSFGGEETFGGQLGL